MITVRDASDEGFTNNVVNPINLSTPSNRRNLTTPFAAVHPHHSRGCMAAAMLCSALSIPRR
jgi:hypothetical protein